MAGEVNLRAALARPSLPAAGTAQVAGRDGRASAARRLTSPAMGDSLLYRFPY